MSMRAIMSMDAGGIETLILMRVSIPAPRPGEILVRVRACGVNFPDLLTIQGKYQFKPPRPFSPGSEVAGDVIRVGADVAGFSAGDAVIGTLDYGGMAEYAVIEAQRCVLKPAAMPYDEAAAFLLTYGTSQHALTQRAALQAGETLLVLGAAGGVGISAVQVGVASGARVIAAASTQEKVDLALANGAAAGIVYPSGPFDGEGHKALTRQFKLACGVDGADVIYDPVGGSYTEAALRAIAFQGRFLVIGFPAGIPLLPLNLTLLKGCQVLGVFYGAWKQRYPAADAENKRSLLALYAAGKLRPHISSRFPLERAGAAIDELASRRAQGKVVVVIGEEGTNSDSQ
jgi:NADPH:quinone reductase